jgi:SAM-dependent methyltransferase
MDAELSPVVFSCHTAPLLKGQAVKKLASEIPALYRNRFEEEHDAVRRRLMSVVNRKVLRRYIPENAVIVDAGCGKGEFINSCRGSRRYALDMNHENREYLESDVSFIVGSIVDIPCSSSMVDVVFSSNLLEHLNSKEEVVVALREMGRILRPGGVMILIGPNIRYVYREYWDYFDHHIPLSHLSLVEALRLTGLTPVRVVPRFLPYTIKSRLPKGRLFIDLYLSLPLLWRIFGRQFLIIAGKQRSHDNAKL